jgi:hypothetical protein
MMLPRLPDEAAFDAFVSAHPAVVVAFLPQFDEELSQFAALASAVGAAFPKVRFARADGNDERFARRFSLAAPCALAIFRERDILYLEPGIPSAAKLIEFLHTALTIDLRRGQRPLKGGAPSATR